MSLAIAMGISMMPLVIWALVEAVDQNKRNRNKHRK